MQGERDKVKWEMRIGNVGCSRVSNKTQRNRGKAIVSVKDVDTVK
jgi:hypothetical protein